MTSTTNIIQLNKIEEIFNCDSKEINITNKIIKKYELNGTINFEKYKNLKTLNVEGDIYRDENTIRKFDFINLILLEKINKINISDITLKKLNLPNNLNSLHIFGCDILDNTWIDNLPINLKICTLISTNIFKLDNLPLNLEYLYCSNNFLTQLDFLPEGLKYLYCSNNKILSLDNLPNSLIYLDCSNNLIQKLDSLPNSLNQVFAKSNQIVSLQYLPPNITRANFSYNPLISKPNCKNSNSSILLLNYSLDNEKSSSTDKIIKSYNKITYGTYHTLKYGTYCIGIGFGLIGYIITSPIIYTLDLKI
jgi:hypothetical protein